MLKVLLKYRFLVNRTKIYVVNAFNACDLDGYYLILLKLLFLILIIRKWSKLIFENFINLLYIKNKNV